MFRDLHSVIYLMYTLSTFSKYILILGFNVFLVCFYCLKMTFFMLDDDFPVLAPQYDSKEEFENLSIPIF